MDAALHRVAAHLFENVAADGIKGSICALLVCDCTTRSTMSSSSVLMTSSALHAAQRHAKRLSRGCGNQEAGSAARLA